MHGVRRCCIYRPRLCGVRVEGIKVPRENRHGMLAEVAVWQQIHAAKVLDSAAGRQNGFEKDGP